MRFKASFPDSHEVFTVRDMRWLSIKNGALLKLLAEQCFDCWIVVDKNIPYQQNAAALPCLIVVLDVFRNYLPRLNALLPRLLEVLEHPPAERLVVITE